VSRQARFYMRSYGHKMCRNRHDFMILIFPIEISRSDLSLTRHFMRLSPAIFTIPALLSFPFN